MSRGERRFDTRGNVFRDTIPHTHLRLEPENNSGCHVTEFPERGIKLLLEAYSAHGTRRPTVKDRTAALRWFAGRGGPRRSSRWGGAASAGRSALAQAFRPLSLAYAKRRSRRRSRSGNVASPDPWPARVGPAAKPCRLSRHNRDESLAGLESSEPSRWWDVRVP